MKFLKIYTVIAAVLLAANFTSAQTTVPNGTFESWQDVGSNTERPTNWNSNKNSGGTPSLGPQTCFRATSPHGGTYCVQVKTGKYFTTIVNGNCTTGKIIAPTFNAADGYIETTTSDANFNEPFTGRPDSLVGWYKYTSVSSDKGKVTVILHKNYCTSPEDGTYQGNNTANRVGKAEFTTAASSTSTWTRFSVPFVYDNGNTPAYFLGIMTSSATQAGAQENSTLWIDDLEVIYNPTLTTDSVSTGPYYVSATTGTAMSVPYTATGSFNGGNTFTAQLSDASGSFTSPTNIGSVTATSSGTISATIPAGTATGTGYLVRVVSGNPAITAADNGSHITINNVSNSIAPTAAQTIAVNTAGTLLTATESAGTVSRAWKYATSSGGPYSVFSPSQTNTNYTPQFATTGTYYVVLETTYPGSLTVRSNEVKVDVVGNSISPTASQSLLVGVSGTQLTVAETPTGTSREWKYSTTSGSGYTSFGSPETGTTYTPQFGSAGTYYVVCQSVISGVTATSNEVVVSVGSATILTGHIALLSYEFSPSAPAASVAVPFITSGTFNGGNTFTAQLSDAAGSFSSATNIGTLVATSSDTVWASLPNTTPEGSGYRIRVVSDNPAILGADNGINLSVDQFSNSVSPDTAQNLALNATGTTLTVSESQTATREWKYSTTSGSGYTGWPVAETNSTYTPQFNAPGVFYIVAQSVNQYGDTVTSNEVQITVNNGTIINTSSVSGSPFYNSTKANIQINVSWTTAIVFGMNNVFTAELSDASGDFSNPTVIGTDTSNSSSSLTATLPGNTPGGTGYRIRVVSSEPPTTGNDNGTDLEVVPFEFQVDPDSTQHIYTDSTGVPVVITISHPTATVEWKKSTTSGLNYASFSPAETSTTFTPVFDQPRTYYVIANVVSQYGDTLVSPEIQFSIRNFVGVDELDASDFMAWWQNNELLVTIDDVNFENGELKVFNVNGQQVAGTQVGYGTNTIHADLPSGMYIVQIGLKRVKLFKP